MFERLQNAVYYYLPFVAPYGEDPSCSSDQRYCPHCRRPDYTVEGSRSGARRKDSLRKNRRHRERYESDGMDDETLGRSSISHPSAHPVLPPVIPPVYPDPPNAAFAHSASLNEDAPILFYDRHAPYYEFTNFAPSPIDVDGKVYPTAEHLFQAGKFFEHRPEFAERIRKLPSPRDALNEAQRLRRLQRPNWFEVNMQVMDSVLEAKFTQHPPLRELLLGTGRRELVEDSPYDAFWGVGPDGQGQNHLGKALMRLRSKLRH